MLNRRFFDDWLEYLCQCKGWGLSPEVREGLYAQCCGIEDASFGTIAKGVAETPGARPDRLLAAVKEHKLLYREVSVPQLVAAEPTAEESRQGAMIGRRFMIWSILCNRNTDLDFPYKDGRLTPTGEWLAKLPWTPAELSIVRTSVKALWAEGFNGEIAKELMTEYNKLFQEAA